ncbi:M10 family metallopeptidase C-terminal domain-containing protein [Rhizobium sp.]
MLNWNEISNKKAYSAERAALLDLLEGSELKPYIDTVGDPTIGIGFNLVHNLEPVLRVMIGNKNWNSTLLARLEKEVEKSYTSNASGNAALQANLDRVMKTWHDTRDSDVPTSFRFKNDAAMAKALDKLAPYYDGRIDSWLSGIPQSREREALFSLCWNAPGLLGPKLKAAIQAGDRAEAWYEIRYNSNGGASASTGIANRRYVEAETFGLFDKPGKATFAEAIQAGQMLARHHETVLAYENKYDADTAGSTKGMPGIDAIAGEMAPAIKIALKTFGLSTKIKVEELLAAADDRLNVSGDGTRYDNSRNNDDMIIGSKGTNILSGNGGDDILAGIKGADTLTGGAGADIFVFTSVKDSKPNAPDTITDFTPGVDRIALSALGDLDFLARANAKFTGGDGEIRWFRSDGDTIVEVDVNGDRKADMRIVLEGSLTLTENDFLL